MSRYLLALLAALALSTVLVACPNGPPVMLPDGGPSTSSSTGGPCTALLCPDLLSGSPPSSACPSSVARYDALVACACAGPCAAACNPPPAVAGDCLAPPAVLSADCKTCRPVVGACSQTWSACLGDDGSPLPGW